MTVKYGLPVSQPWGWAIVEGQFEVLNRDMPPKPELVGQRISLVATEVDAAHAWILDECYGVIAKPHRAQWERTGIIGTVLLEGWMRVHLGEVIETFRPGSEKPFRTRKGLSGPYGWILRQPRPASGDPQGLRLIKARFWETKAYEADLLCYAQRYGCDGMTRDHLAQLERLGFFGTSKGKADDGHQKTRSGLHSH